jgi:L-ascorbate metabolism protein UlaG (beta-lactamase superfamily)
MQIQLIRSATLIVEMAGTRLLIDPWLAEKGAGRSYSGRAQSPLVDLPIPLEDILDGVDAVLISHLHSDHFDDAAQRIIPKRMPILCHGRDADSIRAMGFQQVLAVGEGMDVGAVHVRTTDGQHGPPEVLADMGEVSGFLLSAKDEPMLYWAGDTILCPLVEAVLRNKRPAVVVVHGCGALWDGKGPLVMDGEMVLQTVRIAVEATVVVTHLDAVDHATVSRADIRRLAAAGTIGADRLLIPEDGDILTF